MMKKFILLIVCFVLIGCTTKKTDDGVIRIHLPKDDRIYAVCLDMISSGNLVATHCSTLANNEPFKRDDVAEFSVKEEMGLSCNGRKQEFQILVFNQQEESRIETIQSFICDINEAYDYEIQGNFKQGFTVENISK